MEENSKVYRIRTKVGEDSPNVIHVPINQTYDTFEILSLKLNQTDTYKTYESGYGIIVGRVIANGGFGVPNSKVSVFIEVDDNESLKDTLLYNFTSTSDTDNDGVRYNLLPDYVESECHQDVGTFPNKRLVLDNDDVIEIFDKYWKYTTTTNNSGDYMLFGVPTGSQQLHVDIDLSDCGVLSQRPHNMIGKGYNIGMFESPNKFKSSTNLDSLPQIVTEDRGVYVYPYWGDTSNGDNTFAITRCDINIEYKFEPTAVFMGSIITDKGSNAIGKNCTATINNGKMSELVTGEGTIEMIRKTIDGRVEQFPIMGNRVIDGDGTWVYEIPMNLDYVTTDEFGNFVPTDNPDKGIATRARVRFRVRLDDTQYDNTARKRACYLIPNNPRLEDEGFDKTMEVDYEFGSLTREESYRDLFWNKVYTVKNYIPKIQKGDEQYNRQHTGIKWVNHANHNNPMPYNTLTVKLSFVHRIICILTGLVVQFVAFINQIISLLGFLFATLFDLPSVLFNGLAKLVEGELCLDLGIFGGFACVGDLLAEVLRGIGKGASAINILGRMATKLLTPTCIVLDSGFCDDNVNKVDFYPGCGYFLFNLFPLSSATDVIERGDIAWEKTQEAQQEKYNGKSSDEVRTASNHTGKLHNCYENALAQENEATSFNFNNDWINGTLYAPLWYRKITPKKRFLFGLFTRKAKDEWCTSKQYFASLRYIQHCAVERDGSKTITNFDGDTTDLKFIRNSECVDGDCHERHVALPGLGGVIHSKKTMLGQDVYYYKPVEWSANLPSNELYTGKKKGELKLLFATDIVLLGSLDSCDMNGVPQFFKNLESTTYNMPGDILFTDYEFHYVIDPETGNATSNYNTQDYTVHSEMAGCDWGNPNEFNKKDGGLFYSIGCTNGETELKAKSCVNLSRICEYGVSLDVTKQIPIINNENIGNWEHASESEIEQAEDGTYYKRLITDGFISWDELYNLDERSMFATMNGNQLKTKINTNNGLKEYDFRYLYPENFDGSLAERMKRQTQNYSPEINYKFNYLLEKASRDYYLFRMGNKPYYYDSNNAFPRYENSFYFYFGLNEGKTAIEKFNSKYFAECDNEKGVYNNFNIYKKSSSWCSSLNETYDGFIALDLEKIATPYSIVITGDNTFTLDGITDEKIIFYNKSYSAPEGFEDYAHNKFEEFKDEKTFIPNGSYYITITDANEEEYHYELDMGYNFLMYSNNVQSFKKNHEDLLRSLGTNNAIMNDNTKLVYSNPEKIEREIGGVITVYGVHDNDGDIEQYKIEVREIVDFDKTDIQKTITKEGETWYDEEGNLCKVTSIDKNGTIHYTKNGEEKDEKGNPYTIVGRNTVEDYEGMKKELVVPEWYDKNAVKHNLTEKDKNGKYVYEEGAQQADFNPLVNKLEKDEIWYDTDGNFCKVTSIDTDGTIHYTKNGEGNYTIVGRDTVVDYTDWILELNLPTYYDKNGEKQYYPYEPNKETSVVDFELTDRLKKLTDVGDTWYDADGNFCKVTKIIDGTIHYTKNGKEKDEKDKPYTIVGRNTVVDYRVWTLEVTPPTWYDLDGNFCEVTSIDTNDTNGTIHYTKNGEGDYTISGRNTVTEVTFNSSLENTPYLEYLYNLNKGDEYVKKYDLEDSDGVEYGISYKVISPYALTISEYEDENFSDYGKFDYDVYDYINKQDSSKVIDIDTYDKLPEYNQDSYEEVYVKNDGTEILTKEQWENIEDPDEKDNYDQMYRNKYDEENIITPEDWGKLSTNYCKGDYEVHRYVNKYDKEDIITSDDWGKLPTEYCKEDYAEAYVNKTDETDVISKQQWENLESEEERAKYAKMYRSKVIIHYTKNGEGNYTIVGRNTVVDWSKYIGYEGGEITYDNGVITEIKNVLWYDSEKPSFAFGVPDENRTYVITVTQLCNVFDKVFETKNSIKTNVFVSGVIKYKMFINGIDYEIIKNFDGHTGWNYNGTITKNKLTTNVGDLNENNPWFNVDKIYYHNNFGDNENETYPQIDLKDIDRFGIDKNENEQTYAIYATEIDKEDEEVGKKVNETYHGEDGRNKIVKAEDVIATFVNKRNEDDVTTYKVIDFTTKKLTVVGDTWYDADGYFYEVTSIDTDGTIHYTKNGEGNYTIVGRNTVVDYSDWKITLDITTQVTENYFKQYRNKDVSTGFISPETYNRLPEYNQDSYDVYQYVNKTDERDIISKEQWENLESGVEREKYEPYKYVNKYDETKFITSDEWGKLPEYCQEDYTEVYLSTWYDKNGTLNYMLPSEEGQKRIDFRPLVKTIEKEGETWYDANSVKRAAGSDDIGQEVLDYSKENNNLTQLKEIDFTIADKTWYDKNGIENKADSDKLGLYIDITYMTKGGDTILFNIYNEEYIDKLVIDKLVVKYVNKQDSSKVIDVDTYNQLPDDYGQKSYVEVYVKNDGTEILTKKEWESIEDTVEKDKYVKKYRNKYDATIITPEDWGKLSPDYCKGDYQLCSAYNFNRNGLHNVRIYLTQKTTYGVLLSDVIDFKGCSDLNTIVLPNIGITTIGNDVFNGCKSLTSIDLPDSITAIGNNAFKGCEKLSSVYIPYHVTKIGESAFNGCKSLTNIVLPKDITTIGDNAFANCEKLQSVRAEMTIKNDSKINIAPNAFDNTNIGLIIYVPMDKDEKTYDNPTIYNKEVWGNVKDKVVAIELTVFNYNKVNINPSDLLDEFARNTGDNKIYYNFIDSYVASEYKVFTQVTYFKASDFVNTINNVLSRRREIADRMFNTFYMIQEGESKFFNVTSNTDEMPVQPIIVYHEEEIDDVDIDYTLTTPNLTYEQINMLKNVNIPTITYKSSPFFGDGTSSDDIMITKSNNIEKKPLSTGIMNVKQKSIPLDSGNKDFPSISLSGGVKAIKPSKTNIDDLFEFPVIDKIESSSVSAWTKFNNIPSPNPDHIGMINMDGYVYGRHNNGVVEHDGKFETRKLGKYEINLSENLNNSTKPYTYAERRVITGLANYSMAQWCILKLRNIVQADDVTEETLKKIWDMLFNPKNEKGKPLYNKEKLFDVIDTMTVLKQTIDGNLVIYIQCDETIDGVKPQWKIDQGEEDYITENLIQFKKFNVVANKDYERQYAFTDTKKANLNIGEINENFNFDNELKLSTEIQSIDVSGQDILAPENLTRISFNQGEKEGGHYQLFGLSRYRDGYFAKEDMNQYPLYNAAKNGIVYQIDNVEKETMLSHEGEITKINDKEKQIQGTFNEEYHSSYFYSMYKFKGSNDDERVWRDSESTNGLYNAKRNFNCCNLVTTGIGWPLEVSDAYFLDTNYIRHVYCVYVKGNMKMLSPLYEFAPTQLVGTWGHLESYDERDKSVIGIKVNDFARVYFKNYDYTLGGPFNIKRKYKGVGIGWLSYTIPEGTIKYKDEDYYYKIVDDKLKDKDNKYSYEFENNMGIENMYNNFHKDHVIAKDITDLRHLTWTNGNKLVENNFILIKWEVPESDSFRFISEQKDTETEDFVEKITVEKVYRKGQILTRLPKNNGQYKDGDLWTIQYKEGIEIKIIPDIPTEELLKWENKYPSIITKNIIV